MQFQASKHLKMHLFFILLLHFQSSVAAEESSVTFTQPIFKANFGACGSLNYTSGSQYDTNLNIILPSLSSNGVIRHDSFYNNSYGDGANTVYGYSQCMSGASEDVCRQCLIDSTANIIRFCPNKREATIRYYSCILRYSDQRFFSELDTTIRRYLYRTQNASNVTLFNTQVGSLMNDLTTAAASSASKYAVNSIKYDSFKRIYGLAQCTRDLSESNCDHCLRRMIEYIPNCCDGRTGGNVYSVSCNIRYELYIFFPLPPPPPPPPPTPAGNRTQGTDQIKRAQLTWRIRHNIVNGIARGLLYLHEDSRLKVIHRDLKASNVLLDYEMNPKISDFGLARTFRENQGESNTNKVIGTYGYMAPEYAMDGLFSVKSDVFSFGVLLLEILSGRKNSRSYLAKNAQSLLAYAWRLWCDGKVMELIDPVLIDSCPMDEVLRFVHIGLLCVQKDAADRPTMSSVVLMLGSKSMTLPHPTEPPLYEGKRKVIYEESPSNAKTCSNNEVTFSEVEPR